MRRHGSHRLVILGGFGFDNLGDDLILRSALAQLRQTLGNVDVTVLSNNPFETAARHRGEAVIFSAEAVLRQIVVRALVPVSRYHRKYLLPVPGDNLRRLLASLWKSDLVVSLGGGYLNDYSKLLTYSRLAELLLIGLCRKRLVLYGHEIGPLHRLSLRLLARLALRFVTYATVRNLRSGEVLSSLGFPKERFKVTADEGWAYDPEIPRASEADNRRTKGELVVAMNLMPFQVVANAFRSTTERQFDAEGLNKHTLSMIVAALESSGISGMRLILLPMSSQDAQICSELRALLRHRIPVETANELDSQYCAVARSDILVGMRMHTIMMSAQMGVPPIAIVTLPKLHETMRDIGLSEYALDYTRLNVAEFGNALSRALQNSEKMRVTMSERITRLKDRAGLNAKIVRALLNTTR